MMLQKLHLITIGKKMTRIDSKIKKDVYESKKARDLLDEEFTEFAAIKRTTSEFFNIYNSKFYNISLLTHDIFSKESLQYIVDYINPKKLTLLNLEQQLINIQEDINSIELFHPIFPNNVILTSGGDNKHYFLIQSGKKRRIFGNEMINKVKKAYGHKNKPLREWTIDVGSHTLSVIPNSKPINSSEDLLDFISVINTYTGPY